MKIIAIGFLLSLATAVNIKAQKPDTIIITPKTIKVNQISFGNQQYLVYFKATEENPISMMEIWHLDMQVYSMLPYARGKVFGSNFYEAGYKKPKIEYYTVKGTGSIEGYDGQKIECWLLYTEGNGTKDTYWISKKTKEVLRLEQQIGKMYRYKIKLTAIQ